MPLAEKYDQGDFRVYVWEITETEDFFKERISYRSDVKNASKVLQQMASRYLLELMYPTFPFLQVQKLEGGKLVLKDSPIDFSLTHTTEFSAAIMSDHLKVGIDIEKIDGRVLKVEKKFLNQDEINWLSTLDLNSRIKFTTLCWSIKETVFKWWGMGGIDFANHINIHDTGQFDRGTVLVDFTNVSFKSLAVQYSLIGDHWLTYMASEQPT